MSIDDIMNRRAPSELLPGTLDMLILRTLQASALHGWAISERIQQISEDVLQVNQGSLYPALHRLEHHGWIDAEWRVSELGRRAKYYRLTAAGRRQPGACAASRRRASAPVCPSPLAGIRPCRSPRHPSRAACAGRIDGV